MLNTLHPTKDKTRIKIKMIFVAVDFIKTGDGNPRLQTGEEVALSLLKIRIM